ncbi:MAG: FAD:protein FMN transferase [Candidatus Woesearchaeota archaeon]
MKYNKLLRYKVNYNLLLLSPLIILLLASCSNNNNYNPFVSESKINDNQNYSFIPEYGLYQVIESRDKLGTIVTINAYHSEKDKLETALISAFDEVIRIDNLLSNYKDNSEVSILNKEKIIENISEDIKFNIIKSLYYANMSNGAFDITVQPILDLFREKFAEGGPPTRDEIDDVLKKVDYSRITISERTIVIGNNQKITLGGIAKGYIVDKVADVLISYDIKNALINAGGDIRAIGEKPNGEPWSIALSDPRNRNNYIEIIELKNQSIVTSGDYERYFDPDKRYHHIVDPRTGDSATELISVTIIGSNTMDIDAIATAVFVLGKNQGIKFIEKNNVTGIIITNDREIIKVNNIK